MVGALSQSGAFPLLPHPPFPRTDECTSLPRAQESQRNQMFAQLNQIRPVAKVAGSRRTVRVSVGIGHSESSSAPIDIY